MGRIAGTCEDWLEKLAHQQARKAGKGFSAWLREAVVEKLSWDSRVKQIIEAEQLKEKINNGR